MKNDIVLLIFVLLIATSCSTSKGLEKEINEKSIGQNYFLGMSVVDVETGEQIIDVQGNHNFTPASNLKLFTLYAALKSLPDTVPSYAYHISGDSLIIKGMADPGFLNDSLHDKSVKFLKNDRYKLFFLDTEIQDEALGNGWSWEDYQFAYMAEKNIMPLYGNTLKLSQIQDRIIVNPSFFENSVHLQTASRPLRDFEKNEFFISTQDDDFSKEVPFKTSNQLVADLLSMELAVKVTLLPNSIDRDWSVFREVPYDSLYTKMMKDSDNFIAEQLMLQVGKSQINAYNVPKAMNFVLDAHLKGIPQKPRLVDASGLSRYNLVSPRSTVFLLRKMYNEYHQIKPLLTYFPQGGEGTLKGEFNELSYIHAKSGSLSNNYNLSGYLTTTKGRIFAFSMMTNHFLGSSKNRKKEFANFLEKLHQDF